MEIKTAGEIRAEYAKENFGYTWHEAWEKGMVYYEDFDEVMKIYTAQFIDLAAEKAVMINIGSIVNLSDHNLKIDNYVETDYDCYTIDKDAILELKEQIK